MNIGIIRRLVDGLLLVPVRIEHSVALFIGFVRKVVIADFTIFSDAENFTDGLLGHVMRTCDLRPGKAAMPQLHHEFDLNFPSHMDPP